MRRRRQQTIAENPLLVGSATVFMIIIFVVLAYNANEGLPFVPSYQIKAQVHSGANVVRGNDVRVGGARVGLISSITPKRVGDRAWTELSLKLDRKIAELPRDSTVLVRPRSAIGTKYLEITEGRSTEGVPDGGMLPLANATPRPVEMDELFNTFSDRARLGSQRSLVGFGGGLAGRGAGLNDFFKTLNPLLGHVTPVMSGLADPSTELDRTFTAFADFVSEMAVAAPQAGELWVNLDVTFAAFASVAEPIKETIARAPSTLETLSENLPATRPYLRNVTALMREFEPGMVELPRIAPDLSDMVVHGTPALRHGRATIPKFTRVITRMGAFADDPLVPRGVAGIKRLAQIVNEPLAFITPAQTKCNYAALFFHNIASALSDNDGLAGWLMVTVFGPGGSQSTDAERAAPFPYPDNSEFGPSTAPANGPDDFNRLRTNPYPNTMAPGQEQECEAGRETFNPVGQAIGNVPGNQGTETGKTDIVPDAGSKKAATK